MSKAVLNAKWAFQSRWKIVKFESVFTFKTHSWCLTHLISYLNQNILNSKQLNWLKSVIFCTFLEGMSLENKATSNIIRISNNGSECHTCKIFLQIKVIGRNSTLECVCYQEKKTQKNKIRSILGGQTAGEYSFLVNWHVVSENIHYGRYFLKVHLTSYQN